jgi:hypothetical protein
MYKAWQSNKRKNPKKSIFDSAKGTLFLINSAQGAPSSS